MGSSTWKLLIVVGACLVGTALAWGQSCELDWDVSIGNPGVDDAVMAMAVHDDGTGPALFAGCTFETAGGQPTNNIACWRCRG